MILQPEPGPLSEVRANLGDNYHDAVRCCIEGRIAFGIADDKVEHDIETGAKLQSEFTRLVVDALEEIKV